MKLYFSVLIKFQFKNKQKNIQNSRRKFFNGKNKKYPAEKFLSKFILLRKFNNKLFCLIDEKDGNGVKISRACNSLHTFTTDVGQDFF